MPEAAMDYQSPVGTAAIGKCWNGIYQTLSRTRKRYEELKAQNPNITIIVDEVGVRLKERFLEMIELILLENRNLNPSNYNDGAKMNVSLEWRYGPCTEYFLKNDILGTIVMFAGGPDMPRDLLDELAYMIASLAHDLPPPSSATPPSSTRRRPSCTPSSPVLPNTPLSLLVKFCSGSKSIRHYGIFSRPRRRIR